MFKRGLAVLLFLAAWFSAAAAYELQPSLVPGAHTG